MPGREIPLEEEVLQCSFYPRALKTNQISHRVGSHLYTSRIVALSVCLT